MKYIFICLWTIIFATTINSCKNPDEVTVGGIEDIQKMLTVNGTVKDYNTSNTIQGIGFLLSVNIPDHVVHSSSCSADGSYSIFYNLFVYPDTNQLWQPTTWKLIAYDEDGALNGSYLTNETNITSAQRSMETNIVIYMQIN